MVIPPTGAYQAKDLFNIGENRWRAVAMVGWQRGWTPAWLAELTGEVQFITGLGI